MPDADSTRPDAASPAILPTAVLDHLDVLIATAARAPSVHNSQPWRFRVTEHALELYADPDRRLRSADPDGRGLFISCGAALFGLRLAVRELGYRPLVRLLPDQRRPELLARVHLGGATPMWPGERLLLAGLRRRHTRRGSFAAEPLPEALPAALQRDAEAEAATLVMVNDDDSAGPLAGLVAAVARRQRRHPADAGDVWGWTRPPGSRARDGVPARSYPARPARSRAGLFPRDFDLGRGWGTLPSGAAADPMLATAVLVTARDTPADWLRAGQALHRLLVHAASQWVFASLHTQSLEAPPVRAAIRSRLRLPGTPQMIMQLGVARSSPLTPRRPVPDLLITS